MLIRRMNEDDKWRAQESRFKEEGEEEGEEEGVVGDYLDDGEEEKL